VICGARVRFAVGDSRWQSAKRRGALLVGARSGIELGLLKKFDSNTDFRARPSVAVARPSCGRIVALRRGKNKRSACTGAGLGRHRCQFRSLPSRSIPGRGEWCTSVCRYELPHCICPPCCPPRRLLIQKHTPILPVAQQTKLELAQGVQNDK
jgi:hypothetical protein